MKIRVRLNVASVVAAIRVNNKLSTFQAVALGVLAGVGGWRPAVVVRQIAGTELLDWERRAEAANQLLGAQAFEIEQV